MPDTSKCVAENHAQVMDQIEAACRRAGRESDSVAMVAVTKYAELDWVRALMELGVRELGENRPQQLVERAQQLSDDVHWHLIGHLQRNKVRPILPVTTLMHSIDSTRLLSRIDLLAAELNLHPRILLEVNVSGENVKDGFRCEELVENWDQVLAARHVQISGLMTMAPYTSNSEDSRPVYRGLRDLRDRLTAMSPTTLCLSELSMGMSGDFDVAIEEGATIIRVGRRLFRGLRDA